MDNLLIVNDLSVAFPTQDHRGWSEVVRDISFQLAPGETLGLVGESGSGKSTTALAIKGLLASNARLRGQIQLNLPTQSAASIGMVFQEPMTALNPVVRCGPQVDEAIRIFQKITPAAAKAKTLALFERVKLPDPARIYRAYPHQLSGGQKQRVLIAMALCNQPALLIADEPTTALDSTVQKSILDLLIELRSETNMAILFISHDLGVINYISHRVAVLHQGQIVETGATQQVLTAPQEAYTKGLLYSRPSLQHKWHRLPVMQDFMADNTMPDTAEIEIEAPAIIRPLLCPIQHCIVRYPVKKNFFGIPTAWLNAVDDISFDIFEGEILGIVGESGSGKTTLGMELAVSIPKILPQTQVGVVFQDPYASLNPRMTVLETITEPLIVHGIALKKQELHQKALDLVQEVGLDASYFDRLPHQLSGGQRQRVCIARALSVRPSVLICDEIVSALDVSVQATVLNLLLDIRDRYGLTIVFISHDLSVIHQVCDRVMVMQSGKIVETGSVSTVLQAPQHAYTRQLIAAVV